ncbi:Aminoglycoside phosphotransferase [Penicillium malachiteum]|uniref:Aminoglycoside phosphotransferase n=1 Tax=Penicillium malachiteum TaxID=1324776 RepID=A0AAD6MTZ2_9EURO|nr:Aminoglycoside phosphotransferase [Penicillium malachiteum]
MKPRLSYDDQAWERGTIIYQHWYKYLEEDADPFNAVGRFLATQFYPREWCDFDIFALGGFKVCFRIVFTDTTTALIRFPLPGIIMLPEEKVRNEVRAMRFILEQTQKPHTIPIRVPSVLLSGKKDSPGKLGPFIVMEYIEHEQSICRLLERLESDPIAVPYWILLSTRIVLSLPTITLSKIGSVGLEEDNSTWRVFDRPLSYSMNEIVQLGTLPRIVLLEALATLHISHLISPRNDSIDSEDDCRRKFVARILFQRIVQDEKLRKNWLYYETGPFPIWCDDFRPENVLVDKDENIAGVVEWWSGGVVDWEFTYAAPVEFSYSPPWWLLLEKPEYWTKGLDDWCIQYEHRLPRFLKALADCEDEAIHNGQLLDTQGISGAMRDIYWQKIDQRFFGPNQRADPEDAWKERLSLLTPEETEYINECVRVKSEEMETRALA